MLEKDVSTEVQIRKTSFLEIDCDINFNTHRYLKMKKMVHLLQTTSFENKLWAPCLRMADFDFNSWNEFFLK